ncbi:hypothetical protein GJ496_009611 [Pomphorhynchus laevis]|nr:hypothetical protein GJ496_009611 [Pomphorhynchus laevis]
MSDDHSYRDDDRYKEVITDPRFKRLPKSKRKLKVDKRFKSMFEDKEFQMQKRRDARGAILPKVKENFEKFYDVEESSAESCSQDKFSDQSSDDHLSSSSDEEDVDYKGCYFNYLTLAYTLA